MLIENLLPKYKPIKISSGIDRYGFSHILAQRLNYRFVPRAFANWVHGWVWCTDNMGELIACSELPKKTSIIVNNDRERYFLETEGFKNVTCGGLPFAYVEKQHDYRNDDALLVFPPHSSEPLLGRLTISQQKYFDYIEAIRNDFDDVYISMYGLDINSPMHHAATKLGLKVIQGAHPADANGLLRVRSMLDGFKYVTSNAMGSHMLYSLYAGCKFSFCGPFHTYPGSGEVGTESYIKERLGRFFVEHPREGIEDIPFSVDAIGEKYILQPEEIIDALGWDFVGQLKGYAKGLGRIVSRNFKNS
jgi:hypothetical protein